MNDHGPSDKRTAVEPPNSPTGQAPTFNFSLLELFYLTTVYGISIFYGGQAVVFTTAVLCGWAFIGSIKLTVKKAILIGVALMILLAWSLMPALSTPRYVARRTQCLNQIRTLTFAVLNYESGPRHFPPAQIRDDNGVPMHSWRILILPHLGYDKLYKQYDFKEPWDGPNNIKLVPQMPPEFACPSHTHAGKTTYKLVTGPRTAFVADKTSTFRDIADGSSNSLLIVEDFANPIPWTQPEDLSINEVIEIVKRSGLVQRKPCCAHEADSMFQKSAIGTCVSFIDGSTHMFNPGADLQQVELLCTIDDGEIFDFDLLGGETRVFHKSDAWALLAVYCVLLLLPGWRLLRRQNN